MSDPHVRIVNTREMAHEAITQAYSVAKALLNDGKWVRISVGEDDEPISVKQRRFLHGPVLSQISEQVRVGGERYVMDIWKEHFRKEFLGSRWEVYKLPGAKRATPHKVRNSTEDLSVKKYSAYIDRVIAHAATEWNVAFKFNAYERDAVRWKKTQKEEEAKC